MTNSVSTNTQAVLAKLAADAITDMVLSDQKVLRDRVVAATDADGWDAGALSTADVVSAAVKLTTQDPPWKSKRTWSVVAAVASAALSFPEVTAILGPWGPIASALIAAGLAAWSKQSDVRPVK
jgi:hypothetical protein